MIAEPSRAIARCDVGLIAADGVDLEGTMFRGSGSGPAILVSCAAAVERRFYRAFAEGLVRKGASAVLTYDYRGVGGSADPQRQSRFRMKEWGTLDLPAACSFLKSEAGSSRVVGVGHSFGGLAIGLCGVSERFDRYVMVASLNGWYRRTREPLSVFARMNLMGVPITYLTGRIPGRLGLGTALPGPIFRDWARWCRRPDFFFSDPGVPETRRYADVKLPLLSVGINDDPWGTPEAIGALLRHFPNAQMQELWLGPEDAGRRIGHTGFFRRENGSTLWPPVTRFLLGGDEPGIASPGA